MSIEPETDLYAFDGPQPGPNNYRDKCPSCGIPYVSHLGLIDTCRELQNAKAELAAVMQLAVDKWFSPGEMNHQNNATRAAVARERALKVIEQAETERDRYKEELIEVKASLAKVQAIAKSTLDKLPSRWNEGFQAGLRAQGSTVEELTAALAAERRARRDDNAALTEQIMTAETERDRYKEELQEVKTERDRLRTELTEIVVSQILQYRYKEALERITKTGTHICEDPHIIARNALLNKK